LALEDSRAVIDGCFAAAARGDVDDVLTFWAEDGVMYDWTLDRAIRGHGELRPYLLIYFAAFPDNSFAATNVIVDGSTVVVEWASTATHGGDFFGRPATGRTYDLRGVDIFEVENGKIREERSFYGNGSFLTELARHE
jgi:steroid delta-isomerase-like uncharacterized protein